MDNKTKLLEGGDQFSSLRKAYTLNLEAQNFLQRGRRYPLSVKEMVLSLIAISAHKETKPKGSGVRTVGFGRRAQTQQEGPSIGPLEIDASLATFPNCAVIFGGKKSRKIPK